MRVWLAPAFLNAGVKLFHCPSGLDVAPDLKLHAFTASRGELAVMSVSLKVNGTTHRVTADLDTPLLYVLRNDLGLNGAKFNGIQESPAPVMQVLSVTLSDGTTLSLR